MGNNNKDIRYDRANKTIIKLLKSLTCLLNIKATVKPIFLISKIKKVFNYLKQTFIKALIL